MQGIINFTCDAWQASNTDGYFAVTASWVEESTPTIWKVDTALIGFVRLNSAHNGKRLAQALSKVAARLKIAHKVFLMTVLPHYILTFISNY